MIANTATALIEKRKPKATTKKARRLANKPPLTPDRIYTRAEAALVVGVAHITLIRARDAGHLAELRVGRNVLHSGQQLLDWLASGGKTSSKK
jgi:hypothetical protein